MIKQIIQRILKIYPDFIKNFKYESFIQEGGYMDSTSNSLLYMLNLLQQNVNLIMMSYKDYDMRLNDINRELDIMKDKVNNMVLPKIEPIIVKPVPIIVPKIVPKPVLITNNFDKIILTNKLNEFKNFIENSDVIEFIKRENQDDILLYYLFFRRCKRSGFTLDQHNLLVSILDIINIKKLLYSIEYNNIYLKLEKLK